MFSFLNFCLNFQKTKAAFILSELPLCVLQVHLPHQPRPHSPGTGPQSNLTARKILERLRSETLKNKSTKKFTSGSQPCSARVLKIWIFFRPLKVDRPGSFARATQVFFEKFYCVLRIIHLNYNEKSTFKFIGDLVQVICNNGHFVNQSIEECLFAFYFVWVKA